MNQRRRFIERAFLQPPPPKCPKALPINATTVAAISHQNQVSLRISIDELAKVVLGIICMSVYIQPPIILVMCSWIGRDIFPGGFHNPFCRLSRKADRFQAGMNHSGGESPPILRFSPTPDDPPGSQGGLSRRQCPGIDPPGGHRGDRQ